MPPRHVLAIDEGTTGVTCLVLDEKVRVVGRGYQEIAQHYPKPGWVEHDATEILSATLATARAALSNARLAAHELAAVGITNQRETTVLWDRDTGKPVHNAIVWQDRRTADHCARLKRRGLEPMVRRKTGLVLDPYFCATKLAWLLDNVPGARRRAESGRLAFGTVDAWLTWNLTGGPRGGRHVTDVTNASRTLLWDIHSGAWDNRLLDLFDVPPEALPAVVPSSHVVGQVEAEHLGGEVPLAALVGDQQAALFGQRCTRAGEAKCTYGTGCFLLQHTGPEAVRSRHGLLTTRAASTGRATRGGRDANARFALEGAVFVGGAAVQWLRDGLQLVGRASEVDELASQVPDSGGVQVVPAFTGLGAPYWDPEARGAIVGLTRGTDRRHLAHATLASIAFQCHDVIAAMQKDSGVRIPRLRVDGGATRSAPLLQMQADVLQRPVVRPHNVDTTAVGAALLAGLAVGLWSPSDLRRDDVGDAIVKPVASAAQAKRRLRAWSAAVAAARSFKP